jgi:hypothetical protein
MEQHRLERVAEKEVIVYNDVKELCDAKLVTRREESPVARTPYGKREVAAEVIDALFVPQRVGVQHEIGVGGSGAERAAPTAKLRREFLARIEANVADQPAVAVE